MELDNSQTSIAEIKRQLIQQDILKSTNKKIKMEVILQSTISCPNCGHKKEETMPTDSCQYFYECEKCKLVLKPKQGDCCVYCSYGNVACPPIQQD